MPRPFPFNLLVGEAAGPADLGQEAQENAVNQQLEDHAVGVGEQIYNPVAWPQPGAIVDWGGQIPAQIQQPAQGVAAPAPQAPGGWEVGYNDAPTDYQDECNKFFTTKIEFLPDLELAKLRGNIIDTVLRLHPDGKVDPKFIKDMVTIMERYVYSGRLP